MQKFPVSGRSERNVNIMSILKKTVAALSAVMMTASLFGCSDTSYIMKADGVEINAGVYLNYATTQLQNQIYTLQQSGVTEDYLSQKVDDKNLDDYVSDLAMTSTKEFAAINAKFDELKLEIDSETLKDINSNINDTWTQYQDYYEKQGISKETLKEISKVSEKSSLLFDYYYGEDGVEAVSDDDIVAYVEENYLRYKVMSIEKTTDDDGNVTSDCTETYEEYLKKAQGGDFTRFDEVIDEYNASLETETTTDTETTEDSSSEAADESSEEAAESADETNEIEVEGMTLDELDEYLAAESALEESTESESEDSQAEETADSTADESSEEEDPYPNEQISNYTDIETSTNETYVAVLKDLKDMGVDEVSTYEDDYAYYIYIKGDMTERSSEYIEEDNRSSIVTEMKSDEFQSKIDEWVEAIKFVVNDKALKRYSIEEVYDRYNELES